MVASRKIPAAKQETVPVSGKGEMSVPDCVIKEFLSPVLECFKIVQEWPRPAAIHCLVRSAGESWRLVMTNPKMMPSGEMAPADIANRLEQAWARLTIHKRESNGLTSYALEFWTRDGFGCSVLASECCVELVS